jgi:hypothetical protein
MSPHVTEIEQRPGYAVNGGTRLQKSYGPRHVLRRSELFFVDTHY